MTVVDTTPSQTAGPYLSIGTSWNAGGCVVPPGTDGSFTVTGRMTDGAGDPVTDALLEWWQADPAGRFPPGADPGWSGFARSLTDPDGCFTLCTVKPGAVPSGDGRLQAPHLDVSIFARGLLQRLVTRCYFDDEVTANASDPLLASLDAPAASRLVARSSPEGYRLDVVLQGPEETPFFVP